MVEFPPNLDDGELWLPSDVIRDVGSLHPAPIRPVITTPPKLELLAPQIDALRLLDRFSEPAENRAGVMGGHDFIKLGSWTGPAVKGRFGPAVQKTRSSGTGVFLPRVGNIEFESDWKVAQNKPHKVRVEVGQEQQVQQNRIELKDTKNGGVVVPKRCEQKQERKITTFQGPIEMALPADWTY